MKYILLIHGADDAWTEAARDQCMRDSVAFAERHREVFGDYSALHPVAMATCVRVRNGKHHVQDGPFAETKEHLGGFFLIDVPGMEEAVALASQLPTARKGTVEIRPLMAIPDSLKLPQPTLSKTLAPSPDRIPYLLLMYAAEGAWPPEEHAHALAESVAVCHRLAAMGQYLQAAPLQPPGMTRWLRVREGKTMVRDGPFLETKEHLGGFFLIRVANLDEAIAITAQIPGSHRGTAEIRPLLPTYPESGVKE